MANQVLTLALLATVLLVQTAMSAPRFKSAITTTTKKTSGQEMVGAKDYHEDKNQAAVTYTYRHEEAPKDRSYRRLGTMSQSESQNAGSPALVLRERKIGSEVFYPERETPGGPDSQHQHR